MKKVMFYCQHVLGMGHLMRSMALVEGLRDFKVCFVNGGEMIPGFALPPAVTMVQLPPLKSDADFHHLEGADGQSLAALEATRAETLLAEYERFRPDALIIELFPFGRKKFAFELLPLLARIRTEDRPVKVICSLRDILVSRPDQAKYEARTVRLMNRYFDALLVHADPTWQRLEETFACVGDLTVPIIYTGYVAQTNTDDGMLPVAEPDLPLILVSIGGGRVGHELVSAAIAASGLLQAELPHQMHIFTGPFLPAEQWPLLVEQAAGQPQVTLESYTPHFLAHMEQADLSISLAGYNTCMNILVTSTRALLLPFSGGGNDEQARRAHKLADLGLAGVLDPADLDPPRLANQIKQRLATPPTAASLNLTGVEKTAAFLTEQLAGNEAPSPQRQPLPAALRETLEQLAAANRPIHLFLRDDDADEDEETLRHLLDVSLAYRVPLSLAVIPGRLTEAAIALLKEHKRFHPDLLELHQHGWLHLNHEQIGRKCEFGPSRPFAQQFADIAEGKAVLEEIFGDRFYPAFTPPWNRCTGETLAALDQLGFAVFSKDRDEQPITGDRFREISVTLDLFTWRDGAQLKPPAEIVAELIRQLEQGSPIGLLLHHKVMDNDAFTFLSQLLPELRRYPNLHFHTLQSLNELPGEAFVLERQPTALAYHPTP